MPHGAERVLSRYREEQEKEVNQRNREIESLIKAIDDGIEGPYSRLKTKREGERVQVTLVAPIDYHLAAVDRYWLRDDSVWESEVRRQYRAAGFHDVQFEIEEAGVVVRLITWDDSEENAEERAVRMLSEALRMAGMEAALNRPPESPQDERRGPGEG
jgi:hypothetical protein